MAAAGVVVGLLLGLLAGGRPRNLLNVRLRWLPLLLLGAASRFAVEWAAGSSHSLPDAVRVGALAFSYVAIAAALFQNRILPGMTAAALGVAANGLVIVMNDGRMPVWEPSATAAGFDPANLHSPLHSVLSPALDLNFLVRGGPLADVIPVPIPLLQSVASIGDILLAGGLAFVLIASLLPSQSVVAARTAAVGRTVPAVAALRHPYARLALSSSFSALWLGQIVSSLGDRVHQIALVFLVAGTTGGSPLAVGLAFAVGIIPNLLVGPIAGAYVDRWDYKRVMVTTDLLRAAIVFSIPLAAATNIALVYPLVFVLASVSTFFRPARSAALPLVVSDEDLLTANSAMWTADTAADIAGYPLAGLFVAFLGAESLAIAFWLDAASYVGSAALVAAVAIPHLNTHRIAAPSILNEVREGWTFLRGEVLLASTTAQAMIAEFGLGALGALSPLLVTAIARPPIEPPAAYGYFETAIGVGAVVAGVIVGGVALHLRQGITIIVGFVVFGLVLLGLAIVGTLPLAILLGVAAGFANVAFVVPSQTLFQRRTPPELLGRVIAIRLALVNGVLAAAMVGSGFVAQAVGVPLVLAACGILTLAAGLAGFFVKAIREA